MVRQQHGDPTASHEMSVIRVGNGRINNIRIVNDKVRSSGSNSNMIQVSAVFYITNFSNRLLFVDLKKGLEVCGILLDVYLSRFRNVHGQRFGFAKFFKVRDVEK